MKTREMSISDQKNAGKGEAELITEGDFDIVPAGTKVESKQLNLFVVALLILTASASYGIGRYNFYKNEKPEILIKGGQTNIQSEDQSSGGPTSQKDADIIFSDKTAASASAQVSSSEVVASKNGTKYHYPWCSGAKQISEKNKITFNSIEDARKAGYTPAANCKGLK